MGVQTQKGRFSTSRKNFLRRAGLLCLAAWMGILPLPGWDLLPGTAKDHKSEGGSGKASGVVPIIKMNPLVVNLNEPSGRHYLKATIVLELGKMEWVEEVQRLIPCLMDIMISALGDKKLADMQNPGVKDEIRKELLGKAQKTPAGSRIKQIYFDEFLYQ